MGRAHNNEFDLKIGERQYFVNLYDQSRIEIKLLVKLTLNFCRPLEVNSRLTHCSISLTLPD